MRRALLSGSIVLAIVAFMVVTTGASSPTSTDPTYKIEFDNSFGLVTGADFKVAGIRAGTIKSIDLDQKTLHAVVTVQVTVPGLGDFHQDASCMSRPQSLIGEYFVSCDPGNTGPALPSGSYIPVTHTQSTIAADLLNDIMRMPYRQRFSLIINELGAAVAGRSDDLQAALRRAVPALTQTDNLLKLLADDSQTLQQLTANSDSVITALANNSVGVQKFIVAADNAARDSATQQANIAASWKDLPPFLEQLRPALQKLGQTSDANLPVLENLNAASGQLDRLFTDLPGFAHASLPAFKALGQASVTGKVALTAAKPTITHLNQFAKATPELGQNLAIVGQALDDRKRATEKNPRSPGGKGYTGLESLLQFLFNISLATNTYGPFGHQLAVDAFVSPIGCTEYATPATVAANLKQNGAAYRQCYSWLGPNQVGVNETDPSNPSACVPDPGGAPPGHTGPATTAKKCVPSPTASPDQPSTTTTATRHHPRHKQHRKRGSPAGKGAPGSNAVVKVQSTLGQVGSTIGQIISLLGNATGGTTGTVGGVGSTVTGAVNGVTSGGGGQGGSSGSQAKQLLSYLLSP